MKIRKGFVSNSSSSSFVVCKYGLTNDQKDMLLNHTDYILKFIKQEDIKDYGYGPYTEEYGVLDEYWTITEGKYIYHCYSSQDNFDLIKFTKDIIKVPDSDILIIEDGGHFWYEDDELETEINKMDKIFKKRLRTNKIKRLLK